MEHKYLLARVDGQKGRSVWRPARFIRETDHPKAVIVETNVVGQVERVILDPKDIKPPLPPEHYREWKEFVPILKVAKAMADTGKSKSIPDIRREAGLPPVVSISDIRRYLSIMPWVSIGKRDMVLAGDDPNQKLLNL